MNLQSSVDFLTKSSNARRRDATDMFKDMTKTSALLVKAMARISELEMRVELLSEAVKGKSKVVDLTGEEDKENEEVDVLGSPFCLEPARFPVRDAAAGFLWSVPGPAEEQVDYVGLLHEAFETRGWGQEEVVVGEKNPESPEA